MNELAVAAGIRIPPAALALLLISGCSLFGRHGVAPQDVDALLDDDLFLTETQDAAPQPALPGMVDLYQLPASMTRDLDRYIADLPSQEQRYRALRRWAFDQADRYEYDPGTTAAPADLAAVGRINCFSFSVLFVAAARRVGLPAEVQLVYSPPNWDIDADNWILNQHINVTGTFRSARSPAVSVGPAATGSTGSMIRKGPGNSAEQYVVDLNPDIVVNAHRTERLDEHQVLARFYGNKAAEALVAGDHELAYRYSRTALEVDPASAVVWTNLGVLYAWSERPELARGAYTLAIDLDDDADSARNNLALLYRRLGEDEQAEALEQTIRARRNRNPYYHHLLGRKSVRSGNYADAIGHFQDAIRRKRNEPVFYLALAEAQLALDEQEQARDSLARARRHVKAGRADAEQIDRLAMLEQSLQTPSGSSE